MTSLHLLFVGDYTYEYYPLSFIGLIQNSKFKRIEEIKLLTYFYCLNFTNEEEPDKTSWTHFIALERFEEENDAFDPDHEENRYFNHKQGQLCNCNDCQSI